MLKAALHSSDFPGPARAVLIDYCNQRIGELRAQNDSPKLTDLETAAIRGQIRELRQLLGMVDPKPVAEPQRPKGFTTQGAGY